MTLTALMIGCAAFVAAIVATMIRARRDSDDPYPDFDRETVTHSKGDEHD